MLPKLSYLKLKWNSEACAKSIESLELDMRKYFYLWQNIFLSWESHFIFTYTHKPHTHEIRQGESDNKSATLIISERDQIQIKHFFLSHHRATLVIRSQLVLALYQSRREIRFQCKSLLTALSPKIPALCK